MANPMNASPRAQTTARCRFEQAVYGSFSFRESGYALLAHSPGCRPEWLDDFASACRKFGEPSSSGFFPVAMFSVRLVSGDQPWLIVGVTPSGEDDKGRPGALAFHGLFVAHGEFRKTGYDPFAMASALRGDWGPETTLETGIVPVGSAIADRVVEADGVVEEVRNSGPHDTGDLIVRDETRRIAAALRQSRKVAIESNSPIDDLARSVWAESPEWVRRRCSVATLAFSNALGFDLFATPRLDAVELDESYRDPPARTRTSLRSRVIRRTAFAVAGVMFVCYVIVMVSGMRRISREMDAREGGGAGGLAATISSETSSEAPIDPPPRPRRSDYPVAKDDPGEVEAVRQALATLVSRFAGPTDAGDLAEAMRRFASRRYDGPLLSRSELAAISDTSVPGRSRALDWDALIRHFVADRPLPEDFSTGPLRWQLDTLAWSFHLELDRGLTSAEVPSAIGEVLSLDEPIRPNPLEAAYPTLGAYATFLKSLPVR